MSALELILVMLLSNSGIEITQTAKESKWWGSNWLLWNDYRYEIKNFASSEVLSHGHFAAIFLQNCTVISEINRFPENWTLQEGKPSLLLLNLIVDGPIINPLS